MFSAPDAGKALKQHSRIPYTIYSQLRARTALGLTVCAARRMAGKRICRRPNPTFPKPVKATTEEPA